MTRLRAGAMILAASLLSVGSSGAVAAQSSSSPPQGPTASPGRSVPVIGPDLLGPAPSPPIGPEWSLGLRVRGGPLGPSVLRCGEAFVVITPARDGRSLRVWSSPDGREWSGGTEQALPDATGSREGVGWIVNFGDELIGVGADEARLAVWRSGDCGASWSREADRPELAVEPRGRRISATIAFATDEAVVVIAAQAERGLSFRRWAWLLRRDGSWERSPDPLGLPRALIDGPPDTGHWGVSYQAGVPFMVRSWDLVTWTDVGPLPGDDEPAWDEASGRWLISSQPTDEYPSSAILWSSTDGTSWTEVARTMPNVPFGIPSVHASDGVVVWVVDSSQGPRLMCLAREPSASPGPGACKDWSWAATSVDGGSTWTVSAGWPGMALRGGFGDPAVAIGPDSVVLATDPGRRGESRIWTSAR